MILSLSLQFSFLYLWPVYPFSTHFLYPPPSTQCLNLLSPNLTFLIRIVGLELDMILKAIQSNPLIFQIRKLRFRKVKGILQYQFFL